MKFELMRFIMLPRQQPGLFDRHQPGGSPFDREAWLRDIFGQEIAFNHRGVEFHYVPEPTLGGQVIIVGRVGRKIVALENQPPEAGFIEIQREAWRAALTLIDPRAHDSGQMGAGEMLPDVGRPTAIFDSISHAINTRSLQEPFFLEVNAIVDPKMFWDFEKDNRGYITRVIFELLPPNMFGIRSDLEAELKELRDHERIRQAKIELQNEDGLNLNTPRVEQTVSYTLEGGGVVRARAKTGRRFNSKDRAKRETVDVEFPEDKAPPPLAVRVSRVITKLFGL